MATCRSCGAEIRWVKMIPSGKSNPLDAEPSPKGNIAIAADGQGHVVSQGETLAIDEKLYLSHFATCPNAKQHRAAKGT